MATTERKPLLLDFEKPLAELATRIDQIRQLAEENGVDVSGQIRHNLQKKMALMFLVKFVN